MIFFEIWPISSNTCSSIFKHIKLTKTQNVYIIKYLHSLKVQQHLILSLKLKIKEWIQSVSKPGVLFMTLNMIVGAIQERG